MTLLVKFSCVLFFSCFFFASSSSKACVCPLCPYSRKENKVNTFSPFEKQSPKGVDLSYLSNTRIEHCRCVGCWPCYSQPWWKSLLCQVCSHQILKHAMLAFEWTKLSFHFSAKGLLTQIERRAWMEENSAIALRNLHVHALTLCQY